MAGIEKLKVAVKFGIGLTEAVIDKLDDKKLTWLEIVGLTPDLVDLPGLIRDHELLWEELKDLDDDERAELLQYAKDEFDIEDDLVEDVVEDALLLIAAIADLALDIKKLKPAEEE